MDPNEPTRPLIIAQIAPGPPGPGEAAAEGEPVPSSKTRPGGFAHHDLPKLWRALRTIVLQLLVVLGLFVAFLVVLTGAAGWYTSRPEFCRSCHIMEPYYKSWHESTHKDVSCIECHFAPGFGGKLRGKMLGLVQLAKYVTASEGPRPAAEIPDESCLRSGCHEKRLLAGDVDFHGIPFDHTPHLGELRRGKKLRCTSCHSQIVQGTHMTVTSSTCFLCHFKEGLFNEGLGACRRCHQIPDRQFDLGGGVMFSHDLAYDRGVDCASCHGDLIRGKGEVPRERCTVCHNREDDLKQIDKHVFMHEKHVTEHKVDCLACHLEIHHSLDREKLAHAAATCQDCHPGHHREQLDMLRGRGAKSIPDHPSSMSMTRIECHTCHRVKELSATGAVLWKGSVQVVCATCHEPAEVSKLESYHAALRAVLPEIEAALLRAGKALPAAKLAPERTAALTAELDKLRQDLSFLRTGNDIHNIHYASKLEQVLLDRAAALCRELGTEAPETRLPPPPKPAKGP